MDRQRLPGGTHALQRRYETLCEQPGTEEARDVRIWAGRDFDAELFDRRAANARRR